MPPPHLSVVYAAPGMPRVGPDPSIAQGRKAPFVWRSTDDGDTFVDETDDVITNHPSGGSWFEGKYYLTSSGQGIMAKTFE